MLAYREHHGDIEDLVRHHRIRVLVNMLLANTLIILFAAIIAYGEKFLLWEYPYSYLGMIKTPGGNGNTLSFIIYAAGCLMNSVLCLKISSNFTGGLFRILFRICATGYLLLMLPCDVLNTIHSIGGVLAFGSLWFFSMISIIDLYKLGRKLNVLLYNVLLNASVLPYALLYFVQSPYKDIAQKPALLGLILVIKLIISEMEKEDVQAQEQIN
jgi:hypothetical protein